MRRGLEVMEVLVVSTAHLDEQEAQILNEGGTITDELPSPMTWEYGWIFFIGGPTSSPDDTRYTLDGYSEGFKGVAQRAWDAGLEWVRFDSDGPELDGVPTYDW